MGDEHHRALQLSNELLWQASMLFISFLDNFLARKDHSTTSDMKRNLPEYTDSKLTIF
jgi:hypothetical protein